MHNPESLLENETHKFLRDFEIQTTRPRDSQQEKKKRKEKRPAE